MTYGEAKAQGYKESFTKDNKEDVKQCEKIFEITYRNSLILFGNNIFTNTMKGVTPEKALAKYEYEHCSILTLISSKEIKDS